jgi:hypothetical protein
VAVEGVPRQRDERVPHQDHPEGSGWFVPVTVVFALVSFITGYLLRVLIRWAHGPISVTSNFYRIVGV